MSTSMAVVKSQVIEKYKNSPNDTGSCEVQVAVLTKTIEHLTGHFKINPKDLHSRRGLQRMIDRRRKLLTYLKRSDRGRYTKLIESLGLRR